MGFGGLFSGEANEWDPYNRIHWGGEIAPNVTLEGVEIVSGQDICFEATNTLTVGEADQLPGSEWWYAEPCGWSELDA
jgi:hypothetical protein